MIKFTVDELRKIYKQSPGKLYGILYDADRASLARIATEIGILPKKNNITLAHDIFMWFFSNEVSGRQWSGWII